MQQRKKPFKPSVDERVMRLAVNEARAGIRAGGGPFGCVITRRGRVIAAAHNTVVRDSDATAHAEIKAIRAASSRLRKIFLDDCTVYATGEPCPMCFAACWWARVPRIVYGSPIAAAAAAGLNELRVSVDALNRAGGKKMVLRGGVLRRECASLFAEWKRAGGKKY
jgi:tRNA(Arg) A34 adenosine deaminase TadA